MASETAGDEKHSYDRTLSHSWIFEDARVPPSWRNVLTDHGLENIASHKYVPGECTHLDNLVDPVWNYLTNLLPLWLAPNVVTTIGGLHCLTAYLAIWYYSPNLDALVPDYVIFLAGYCLIAYHTLDSMDGKQARRTGASSPLGQLFDHGVDCICNINHSAVIAAYLMNGGTLWFFAQQSLLQFAFFCAQWEEYHTRVLPHGCGKWIGVTEVNYGMGLVTIAIAFIDREQVWLNTTVGDVQIFRVLSPKVLHSLSLGEFGICGWIALLVVLIILCFKRVHDFLHSNDYKTSLRLSAFSKLISPAILTASAFILPIEVIQNQTRELSIVLGIVFSLITKKMIVCSMAKMSYAALQLDILPYVLWILHVSMKGYVDSTGSGKMLTFLCFLHLFRLVFWCERAISQIKEKLDIYCFTIKKETKNTRELDPTPLLL